MQNKKDIRTVVARLAEVVVRAQGLVIWGVDVSQGGRLVVRLFVDVPREVPQSDTAAALDSSAPFTQEDAYLETAEIAASIGQCEEISRQLSLALDVEDLIPGAYVLEVSTPGLDRQFFSLAQMRHFLGDLVEARLAVASAAGGGRHGRRRWLGRLLGVGDGGFVLAPAMLSEAGEVEFEAVEPVRLAWADTRRVARVPVFRRPAKPGGAKTSRKRPDCLGSRA